MPMSKRMTTTIERARSTGFLAAAMAVALVFVGDLAAAQPRSSSLLQQEESAEPLAPAQREQLFPTQRGGVSLAQATSMAQGRYPGRVVSARSVQMGERLVHEIRILGEDNRVHIVRIDAQTGSFL
jgi:uncharacterized membrane protein YkoI